MSEKKHRRCKWWIMLLCCAVPLLIITGMQYIGYHGVASWLALLLCPLTHGVMMWLMYKNTKQESAES